MSVEGTSLLTVTDSAGRFRLARVPPGPQVLLVRQVGYAPARTPIVAAAAGVLVQDVQLARAALQLKGIIVTADPAGRARGELGTASVIEREAINNQTAASLAGILELTPGVPLSPPGLDAAQQAPLRAVPVSSGGTTTVARPSANDLAAFGTLIVLDGVPVSNNANLQSTGARGELTVPGTAGGGIDLRRIPGSTLERVEVIRGVPSARYGDLTSGAIIVDTRAAAVAPELSARYDGRTAEATVVGGANLGAGRHAATLTLDVAHTRLAPGVREDAALRFAAQFAHRFTLGGGPDSERRRPTFDTRLDLLRLLEDNPEKPELYPGVSSRAHDTSVRLSHRARFPVGAGTFTVTLAADHTRQRSSVTSPLARGAQPFTDRLDEGRSVGHFVFGQYVARLDLQGDPWLIYGRAELERPAQWLGLEHRGRAGIEWRREWNAGPGYLFDVEFPPQAMFNGVVGYDRPRRFDRIPAVAASALYLDDRMLATPGGVPLDIQAGLRLDALHRGTQWLSGARDAVVQPRLNVQVAPRPWLRLRAGAGRTAKLPSVADLYPAPDYYDVVNVNWFANDPAERLAVLSTFVQDPTNPDLGFSVATKREAGLEVSLGRRGGVISAVAFDDRTAGAVAVRSTPSFILRDHYDLSDSTLGTGRPPQIIEPPSYHDTVPILINRPANIVSLRSHGYEVTAFLPEIAVLRTRLEVNAAWVRTRLEKQGFDFGVGFGDFQLDERRPRAPYWDAVVRTGRRTIVTTRLVHHQPALGLVITLTVQHLLDEVTEDIAGTDSLAFAGYITRAGALVTVPPAQRADSQYADLHVTRSGLNTLPAGRPDDWLASLQVAKTLPLGGRMSFYAFNALDREGSYRPPQRVFPALRFGVEVSMPLGGAWRP